MVGSPAATGSARTQKSTKRRLRALLMPRPLLARYLLGSLTGNLPTCRSTRIVAHNSTGPSDTRIDRSRGKITRCMGRRGTTDRYGSSNHRQSMSQSATLDVCGFPRDRTAAYLTPGRDTALGLLAADRRTPGRERGGGHRSAAADSFLA